MLITRLLRLRREVALPGGRPGSCALRHVDAGSCNGCEMEMHATTGPHYDIARHGLQITASPRHADVLLVTGPITTRMVEPLRRAYAAMPEPRLVAALGDCPLGDGVECAEGRALGRLEDLLPVDIRIPGCPPEPAVIAEALVAAMAERGLAPPSAT
jgi:Ni,Fe-hydrogenase III small subunit